METKEQQKSKTANREISISRILNAPRELVWEVWTDPKHIVEWWGPNGFSDTINIMDVRPGGRWLHTMHGPDGKDYPNDTTYTEVVKPERLAYTHPAPKFDATVTFEKLGDKTKLTMTMVFDSSEEYNFVVKEHGAIEGQVQTINRLEEHLAKLTETKYRKLVITRTFNTRRAIVYKAFASAEALAQWWGPKGSKIKVQQFNFKPGGIFHYYLESEHGVMWGRFHYLEIVDQERIVFTNSFSDKEANIVRAPFSSDFPLEIMNILTLTEQGGETTMILKGSPINATESELKFFINMFSSMQQGFAGTFEQLDEYLSTLTN